MECEMKDECENYSDECTVEICPCGCFEELTEETKLKKILDSTIEQLSSIKYHILLDRIKNYEAEVKRQKECIRNARITIEDLEKQILNKNQLRKECLQEVRKEVFGPFGVGQKVFYVKLKNNRTPCPECKGTRKITCVLSTKEETKVECPKCHGRGELDNYTKHPEENRIKSIVVDTFRDNVGRRETVTSITYYMEWNDLKKKQSEIFSTAEECQAYIDSLEKK